MQAIVEIEILFIRMSPACVLFFLLNIESIVGYNFEVFLNSKEINRGMIISCESEVDDYEILEDKYVSYYDLERRNAKLDDLPQKIHALTATTGVLYNLDCKDAPAFIQNISSFETFNSKIWFLKSRNFKAAFKILKTLDIHLNSDVTLGIISGNSDHQIYEVYRAPGNELIVNRIKTKTNGVYTTKYTDEQHFEKSKIMRRRNFLQAELKAGIAIPVFDEEHTSLVEYLESGGNMHSASMQRKNYQIVCIVKDFFNFRMQLVRTSHWGTNENGTWNGVVGLNYMRITNFSISTIKISIERYKVIDVLPITHIVRLGFVFRHPINVYLRNVFLDPFKDAVWIVIIIFIVTFIFTFRFVNMFDQLPSSESSFTYLILIILGAITQQGTSSTFRLLSARILFSSILILSFLVYQFYSAFLVGSLLSEPPKKINTPLKLYNSQLRIGMEDIAYNYDLMNISSTLSRNFLEKRISDPKKKNIVPFNEGLQLIKKGGFAFHVDTLGAYRYLAEAFNEREFCRLKTIYVIAPIPSSISFPKKAPMKEYFTNVILRMTEFGILDYISRLWEPTIPNCESVGKSSEESAVQMENLLPLFVMLSCGFLTSLLVLCMECLSIRIFK